MYYVYFRKTHRLLLKTNNIDLLKTFPSTMVDVVFYA